MATRTTTGGNRTTTTGCEPDEDALAEVARDLYGEPRGNFIAARTSRVKQLRDDGAKDLAALVGKLAKPSLVAWAVNAAVRAQPSAANDLVAKVGAMQASGSGRANAERHDELVQALAAAARSALRDAGEQVSATRMASVTAAIRSAALAPDPTAFLEGRLANETRSSDDTLEAALLAGAAAGPSRERSTTSVRVDQRRAQQREVKARQTDAKAASRAAAADLRDAERVLERAQRALEAATSARDDAAAAHEHAQRLAAEAAEELDSFD